MSKLSATTTAFLVCCCTSRAHDIWLWFPKTPVHESGIDPDISHFHAASLCSGGENHRDRDFDDLALVERLNIPFLPKH